MGAMVLSLPSCGLFKKWFGSSGGAPVEKTLTPEEEEAQKTKPQVVGQVASVHLDGGFVLIRRFGTGGLPEGYVYNSQGKDGRTAGLRPTGERLGRFYAADITGGGAEIGDLVVGRRLPEGAVAPSTPLEEPKKLGFQVP